MWGKWNRNDLIKKIISSYESEEHFKVSPLLPPICPFRRWRHLGGFYAFYNAWFCCGNELFSHHKHKTDIIIGTCWWRILFVPWQFSIIMSTLKQITLCNIATGWCTTYIAQIWPLFWAPQHFLATVVLTHSTFMNTDWQLKKEILKVLFTSHTEIQATDTAIYSGILSSSKIYFLPLSSPSLVCLKMRDFPLALYLLEARKVKTPFPHTNSV